MTHQEIIEANRLLAEFTQGLTTDKDGNVKEDLNGLKYHTSWYWIMQVVEEIANICEPTTECPINRKRVEIFKSVSIFSDISEVYKCCVDFVKWYNENKAF